MPGEGNRYLWAKPAGVYPTASSRIVPCRDRLTGRCRGDVECACPPRRAGTKRKSPRCLGVLRGFCGLWLCVWAAWDATQAGGWRTAAVVKNKLCAGGPGRKPSDPGPWGAVSAGPRVGKPPTPGEGWSFLQRGGVCEQGPRGYVWREGQCGGGGAHLCAQFQAYALRLHRGPPSFAVRLMPRSPQNGEVQDQVEPVQGILDRC